MTLEKILEEIGDPNRPLTNSRMVSLSGLPAEERSKLAAMWPMIPVARKERVARLLIELAEDNVELDFEYFFRICLNDPDAKVRAVGIEGLNECHELWLLDRLTIIVRGDESAEVRGTAATVLGRFALMAELGDLRLGDVKKVDEALISVFENESESVNVRRRAIESLGVRSNEKTMELINRAYASQEHELRIAAIYAMGRNCDERWLNTLVKELSNPDPEIRYEAVGACGELEDRRTVTYLIPLLEDKDMLVRLATITALGHIGGPRAKEELMGYVRHPSEQIREAAEEALEELAFNQDPIVFGMGN